ncbi:Branched-chain amino acid ABC transporter, amino acid-binding protein [Dissulfuribacter thermophilus]|uniref:Branched-chain amino acid ABC transporter, amino acid-binding protein n=1 Tax=Dissulfuribacter thermophilus TaxID=1156395 RepID=A0A1B9F396_9BACT|nr:ABC transporter substrate-binding protein [Dissulfuribacter thermophilus]OCC14407.1 Branched-chain amino acid ABC transporter, amino acid-binding protein [Dissulfuribacter thermophilus]
MVKKFLRSILIFLIFSTFFLKPAYSGPKPIKVGALLDLSGPNKDLGNAMLIGAKKAIKMLNPRLEKLGYQFDLLVVDTSGQEGRLLLGAMRLQKNEGVMAIIGPTESHLSRTLRAFSEIHELLLILTSGTYPLRPTPWDKYTKWTFSVFPDIGIMIKSFYYSVRKMGLKKVGILVETNSKWEKDITWLKAYAPEFGIKITSVEGFGKYDTDCSSQLKYLKDLETDIILFRGDERFLATLFKSLRNNPIKLAFLMDTPVDVPVIRNYLQNGTVFLQNPMVLHKKVSDEDNLLNIIRFKNAISESTIRTRDKVIAASLSWDAIGLLAEAFFNEAIPTKEGLLETLNHTTYHGIIGTFTIKEYDHNGLDQKSLTLSPVLN